MSLVRRALERLSRWIGSKLPTERLTRGIALIAGGNALAQVLTIAASPILTRLYTPAEFGTLAVYMSLTTILGVTLSGRYQVAIALPETDREALEIVKLSLAIVLFSMTVSALVVLFLRRQIADALNAPALGDYLLLLPLSVLVIGSFTVFRLWSVRSRQFSLVGRVRIRQVFASLIVQILGAPLGALGLLLGQLANQGVGMRALGRGPLSRAEFREANLASLRTVLVRYRRFPLLTMWSALLNRVSLQLPTLFFSVLFGPAAVGFYALANRILKSPSGVFVGAINDVFLTTAPVALREGWLRGLVLATHERMSNLAMPPLALASVAAPQLFGLVFGEEWSVAGEYGRWLVILVYFSLVASPLSGMFSVLEKQGHDLFFQSVLLVVRAAALLIGARYGDAVLAVALFCLASAAVYLAILVWVARQVDDALGAMCGQFARVAAISLAIAAPAALALLLSDEPLVHAAGLLVGGALCAWHLRRVLRRRFDPQGKGDA